MPRTRTNPVEFDHKRGRPFGPRYYVQRNQPGEQAACWNGTGPGGDFLATTSEARTWCRSIAQRIADRLNRRDSRHTGEDRMRWIIEPANED